MKICCNVQAELVSSDCRQATHFLVTCAVEAQSAGMARTHRLIAQLLMDGGSGGDSLWDADFARECQAASLKCSGPSPSRSSCASAACCRANRASSCDPSARASAAGQARAGERVCLLSGSSAHASRTGEFARRERVLAERQKQQCARDSRPGRQPGRVPIAQGQRCSRRLEQKRCCLGGA